MRLIKKQRAGFTLFEILIAMFIFSIVCITIFGSYQAVFSKSAAIVEGIDTYQMVSNCLNRITEDLKGLYLLLPPEYVKPALISDPDTYQFMGDHFFSAGGGKFPRLRFTSDSHLKLGTGDRSGIAAIVYYVGRSRDGLYGLRRSETLSPYPKYPAEFEDNAGDPVLCEGLKSLTFTYFDAEGHEYENWNSDSQENKYSSPRAIRIKLEIGDDSHSLFFQTMIIFPIFRDPIE